jgi:hypothetical protein
MSCLLLYQQASDDSLHQNMSYTMYVVQEYTLSHFSGIVC